MCTYYNIKRNIYVIITIVVVEIVSVIVRAGIECGIVLLVAIANHRHWRLLEPVRRKPMISSSSVKLFRPVTERYVFGHIHHTLTRTNDL